MQVLLLLLLFFAVLCVTFMGVTRELFLLPSQRKRKQRKAKGKGDRKLAGREERRRTRTIPVTFKLLINQLPMRRGKFLIKPNCL